MAEIKERLKAIQEFGEMGVGNRVRYEACFLQLRHVCELLAMACLAAQGDFKTQRAFREEYSPPKIFGALREFYPHFFPQPATLTTNQKGHHIEANSKPEAYGEKEIVKLWHSAGSHLHRASLNKFLKERVSSIPTRDEIQKHMNGVIRLLESHLVPVSRTDDNSTLLLIALEDGSGGSQASWMHIDHNDNSMRIEQYTARTRRVS